MPKQAKLLTDKEIRSLTLGCHAVGGVAGLYLRKIDNSQCFYFRVRRKGGKPRDWYFKGIKSVKEARIEARKLADMVSHGLDPWEVERQKAKELEAEKVAKELEEKRRKTTFKRVFDAFYREEMVRELSRPEAEYNRVRNYFFPLLGEKPIGEISEDDIHSLFADLYQKAAPTAQRVERYVKKCFKWVNRSKRYGDIQIPFTDDYLDLVRPAKKAYKKECPVRNRASLPFEKIPDLCKSLLKRSDYSATLFLFSILTATRSQETRWIKWRDLDIANEKWVISLESFKVKDRVNPDHRTIYLSTQAVEILMSQPKINGCSYVFPRKIKPNGTAVPFGDNAFRALIERMNKEDGNIWIDPHQLDEEGRPKMITQHATARSTFRTWGRDFKSGNIHKYDSQALEYCLLHFEDKYNGAYDRNQLEPARRQIMQEWADYCLKDIDLSEYLKNTA